MPSQIRWDEHVMNPSLIQIESVNAEFANCISLKKTTSVWIRNQWDWECMWECMFHTLSLNSPQANDL